LSWLVIKAVSFKVAKKRSSRGQALFLTCSLLTFVEFPDYPDYITSQEEGLAPADMAQFSWPFG
jgi:hypothetical protein